MKIKEVATIALNEEFGDMSDKEVLVLLKERTDKLNKRWIDSKFTDFSIYKEHEYLCDVLVCWWFLSRNCVANMLSFFRKNVSEYKSFSYFDDYNGVGASTVQVLKEGLHCDFYNDNEEQKKSLERLCDFYSPASRRVNNLSREGKYDVVMSFECAEHYKEPMRYVEEVMSMTREYLVISTGFRKCYTGHFEKYLIDGEEVSIRRTGMLINKRIKKDFILLHTGWNAKPRIFKRKKFICSFFDSNSNVV